MALIELHKVSKTYQSGNLQVPALIDFDLQVEAGEFTALAGPSGSGKTTALNLIGGIDIATRGCIHIAGREIRDQTVADLADFRLNHIGFIFQSYNLIPVLTAYENAEFVLMLQGVAPAQRRRIVQPLLKRLGLETMADRRPNDLSGGQQQRVAVARAMAASPDVILADEPTANLDSTTATELLELMHELNQEKGVTFLFSSHDPLVLEHARRTLHLQDGQKIREDRNDA